MSLSCGHTHVHTFCKFQTHTVNMYFRFGMFFLLLLVAYLYLSEFASTLRFLCIFKSIVLQFDVKAEIVISLFLLTRYCYFVWVSAEFSEFYNVIVQFGSEWPVLWCSLQSTNCLKFEENLHSKKGEMDMWTQKIKGKKCEWCT